MLGVPHCVCIAVIIKLIIICAPLATLYLQVNDNGKENDSSNTIEKRASVKVHTYQMPDEGRNGHIYNGTGTDYISPNRKWPTCRVWH